MTPARTNTTDMQDGVIGRDEHGCAYVYFERFFEHPVAHVWRAITDPAEASGWLGSLELEPRVGGRIAFRLDGTDPEHGFVTEGRVTEFSRQRLLACWIHAEGAEDPGLRHMLRFELHPIEAGTRLEFTHTFAANERPGNSIVCGWHNKLEQIADTADGYPTDWNRWNRDRVTELYWRYRNKSRQ